MAIFKDKVGNTYKTENKFVIDQMKKSKEYQEINVEKEDSKKTLTVAEIKAKLDELGIEYDKNANKETLLALLPQE